MRHSILIREDREDGFVVVLGDTVLRAGTGRAARDIATQLMELINRMTPDEATVSYEE